jgi:hypothetical protein
MKPLSVEFAPKRPLPAWVWVMASVLMLGVAAQQGWDAWRLTSKLHAAQVEHAGLKARLDHAARARREAEAALRAEPAYAKDLAAIAKMASFPLDRVLASVESAQVVGARLTSIEVSAVEGVATAELEFSDQQALGAYLDAVNAGESEPRWRLVQARAGTQGAPGTASIVSSWKEQ